MPGIDASIYQADKPVPVQMPDLASNAEKAMTLSSLGMQQAQAARQMQMQTDMARAYAQNTDQNGNVNQQGVLAQLGRVNPLAAMQARSQFNEMNKQTGESQTAQMAALHQTVSAGLPYLQYALNLPQDQAAKAWPQLVKQMQDKGIPTQNLPPQWDRGTVLQSYGIGSQYKESLENELTKANIGKTQSEIGDKFINRATDYQKMLNSDDTFKRANDTLASAKSAAALIEDAKTNPASRTQLGFALATMMNNGQPIRSPDEMKSFLEKLPAKDKFRETLSNLTNGKLDDHTADMLMQTITVKAGQAAKDKADRTGDIAGQFSAAAGIPIAQAHSLLSQGQSGLGLPKTQDKFSGAPVAKSGGSGMPGVKSANASEIGPHGMSVKQGGYTYKWNPKTGKYE